MNEITGFSFNQGTGYEKSKFVGCARASSGIIKYTETGNAVFSNNTTAQSALVDTEIKMFRCFICQETFRQIYRTVFPDVPELDYKKIDVRNAIKSVKDFYSY